MSFDSRGRRAAYAITGMVLAAGAAAGPASATTVIGAGNSAHDNTCRNASDQDVAGSTGREGVVQALWAVVPLAAPANQCGDLGLPKEEKAEQPPENFHIDVAE